MDFNKLLLPPNVVVIQLPPDETVTESGIIMPNLRKQAPTYGEVMHFSSVDDDYKYLVDIGYEVHFREHSGVEMKVQGETLFLINAKKEILFSLKS